MYRIFRIIKLIFLAVGVLLLLAIPISGFVSAGVNWQGVCEKEGVQSPCTWWQFAFDEMFWFMFLFIPFFFAAAVAWFGMSAAQFVQGVVQKARERRPEKP